MNRLFKSIDILDDKSLTVLMDNTRSNLWILRHFKNLTISNKNICYQVNNGHRQRKNTKHPYRWMRKKFSNTAEFLIMSQINWQLTGSKLTASGYFFKFELYKYQYKKPIN